MTREKKLEAALRRTSTMLEAIANGLGSMTGAGMNAAHADILRQAHEALNMPEGKS